MAAQARRRSGRPIDGSLDDPVWRRLRVVLLGSILLWVLHVALGGETLGGSLLVALLGGATWAAAASMLLLQTAARRLWLLLLAACALLLILFGPDHTGRYIALGLTVLFLLLRRYAAYRHLSGKRRATFFLLGAPILLLMAFGLDVSEAFSAQAAGWFHGTLFNIGRYCVGALQIFWLLSLLNVFFRMRLHSWRLKPKLAISAMLLAIVPLALVVTFALLALLSTVGGSRAMRGRAILHDWAATTATCTQCAPAHFDTTFSYRASPDGTQVEGVPPRALERLIAALHAGGTPEAIADSAVAIPPVQDAGITDWEPADTTGYFALGTEMWLLRLRGVQGDTLRIDGFLLSRRPLDRLAGMLGCDVGVYASTRTGITVGGEDLLVAERDSSQTPEISLRGYAPQHARDEADPTAPADEGTNLRIGASFVNGFQLVSEGLVIRPFILHLRATPRALIAEFIGGENLLAQAVAWILAIIAAFFLILEAFALFLAVRIAGGITGAVATLHRGTRRLAAGDLHTRIELPNRDEFGELAESFNEMTVAVRHGQEQAVARERLERELETARKIQERLLPSGIPAVPGFEITGTSVPSRQVGGDYFDVLSLEDGRLGIAIGDVSGKGMPAALLMSNLQASLQGQVIHPSSVAEVVKRMNDLLARSTDPHMFATFFYGVLDPRAATFTSVNAGHNPPVVLRAGGKIETLHAGGLVLGMLPNQNYRQEAIELAPGDLAVLYTDGITEATAPPPSPQRAASGTPAGTDAGSAADAEASAEEDPDLMFGEERLHGLIARLGHRSASEIKQAILEAVSEHAAGTPQADDITLVVIKRVAA
ncbi:MAG: SpoIIE family protein phosphatase [Candidatus Eisenbacteria bacterium]|nr:SpoIIE family protein phosphatase [Candidatus Eisenbacteria bacterium]